MFKKAFKWISSNILFVFTLFLLAFIPLYPKVPLLDVKNTWVYVRGEDFVVLLVLFVWSLLLLLKKVTLRTPLTIPILVFWIVGAIATIHGVLLIFPTMSNVFPNVAFLSYLRHVEYLSLFFIAFLGMKEKKFLSYVIAVLTLTMLGVIAYGFGQKYFGFPAFLTMNEEFAKGIPIQLSQLSRVPSTFAGHYDLAAYLVLVVPILTSLMFGIRNWIVKVVFLGTILLGFVLLFMTVSRISFIVLLVSLAFVLFFYKRRFVLFSLPIVALIMFLFVSLTPALFERFGNTIKEVDVLVDARTGEALGHVHEVPLENFEDKVIRTRTIRDRAELEHSLKSKSGDQFFATASAKEIFPKISPRATVIVPTNAPTGENLPQGTGYINLSLSPVTRKVGQVFYERPRESQATGAAEVLLLSGNFLVKRASAYDLSFTTRFQGEWPKALAAFKKNILLGSGYGSISLAIDNNFFRILGEIGLLGFASFLGIFVTIGIYIKKALPNVDSPVVRSFVIGFVAGVLGLSLNAIFIDVFEASKIAFLLWLLAGVTLGILHFYQTKSIDLYRELKNVVTSTPAIISYLLLTTIVIFSPMLNNFFVGDDFTWFRWILDGPQNIAQYFTQADGFFYRPGTKVYFYLMHTIFWLNQVAYHAVSIALHFVAVSFVFLIAKKVLRGTLFPVIVAFLFLILSGYGESVFWISSTGYLFNAIFTLLSLYCFMLWEEKKQARYFVVSLISITLGFLFHELGVVVPLLLIAYKLIKEDSYDPRKLLRKTEYMLLFLPLIPYFALRLFAHSHWFSGDYSYNLLKLPFNVIGNGLGYGFLGLLGPISLPLYQIVRNISKGQVIVVLIATGVVAYALFMLGRMIRRRIKIEPEDRRTILFGIAFFVITLLPFLGLGNITSRYSYLASFGLILLFVLLIQKLYWRLLSQGRDIALSSVTMIITVFCLLHVIQLQQLHSDWYEAGKKSERFFVSIDEQYKDYWATEPMEFHFVNVPIKEGEAWIFPVGLEDALWLTFRNPDMRVYKWATLDQAFAAVDGSLTKKVFEFETNGRVIERDKPMKAQ